MQPKVIKNKTVKGNRLIIPFSIYNDSLMHHKHVSRGECGNISPPAHISTLFFLIQVCDFLFFLYTEITREFEKKIRKRIIFFEWK